MPSDLQIHGGQKEEVDGLVVKLCDVGTYTLHLQVNTPGSMNSPFSDFFKAFWRGTLGGCSELFRGYVGRFLEEK